MQIQIYHITYVYIIDGMYIHVCTHTIAHTHTHTHTLGARAQNQNGD